MHYMTLNLDQREEFLAALANMPVFLRRVFAGLDSEQARTLGPDGTPSPVEQVWHLADLEGEGFGQRIRRLVSETEPHLPDFNGAKVAAERNYRALSLEAGLVSFAVARRDNLAALRALNDESWYRVGTQEGVGRVSICDIPAFMAQHDSVHRNEIEAWLSAQKG
jgi:DinB superfamily